MTGLKSKRKEGVDVVADFELNFNSVMSSLDEDSVIDDLKSTLFKSKETYIHPVFLINYEDDMWRECYLKTSDFIKGLKTKALKMLAEDEGMTEEEFMDEA